MSYVIIDHDHIKSFQLVNDVNKGHGSFIRNRKEGDLYLGYFLKDNWFYVDTVSSDLKHMRALCSYLNGGAKPNAN